MVPSGRRKEGPVCHLRAEGNARMGGCGVVVGVLGLAASALLALCVPFRNILKAIFFSFASRCACRVWRGRKTVRGDWHG